MIKIAAAAILDFQNSETLRLRRVKRVKMRHRAKICGTWSNRCWGGDFFIFPRWWLWFCNVHIWIIHKGHLVVFITVQNFGWNRYSSFDKMQVLIFCEWGFKTPIHSRPQNGFFGGTWPLNGRHINEGHILKHKDVNMTYRSWRSVHQCELCTWQRDRKKEKKERNLKKET